MGLTAQFKWRFFLTVAAPKFPHRPCVGEQ